MDFFILMTFRFQNLYSKNILWCSTSLLDHHHHPSSLVYPPPPPESSGIIFWQFGILPPPPLLADVISEQPLNLQSSYRRPQSDFSVATRQLQNNLSNPQSLEQPQSASLSYWAASIQVYSYRAFTQQLHSTFTQAT